MGVSLGNAAIEMRAFFPPIIISILSCGENTVVTGTAVKLLGKAFHVSVVV